jgi:cytidine deaminase
VILETERRFGEKIRLLLYGRKVVYEVNGIDALMPLSFDSSNLEG